MGDISTSPNAGLSLGGYRRGGGSTDPWDQYVIPVADRVAGFAGRALSFATPGRGATTQRLISLHNGSGSGVLVNVNRLRVDVISQAAKVIGSVPPTIRAQRFTTAPTGGTGLPKTPLDSGGVSSALVTVLGDASAEATLGTALSLTPTGTMEQSWGPRLLAGSVGAGTRYEQIDTVEFLLGHQDLTVREGEGMCISLENAAAAGNLSTDRWICGVDWVEYTRP